MAQLQWLGTLEEETSGGYLAKALGKGITGFAESYEETKEKERAFGIKEEEVRYKIDSLSHEKKVDAARLISSVMSHMSDEKRKEMIEDSEIQAVFASAGVPIPATPTPEKSETWMESWMKAEGGEQTEVGKWDPRRLSPSFSYSGGAKQKRFPSGTTEENIQHTMKKHGLTRRQLLEKIGE